MSHRLSGFQVSRSMSAETSEIFCLSRATFPMHTFGLERMGALVLLTSAGILPEAVSKMRISL